jgi:predicted esterase
VIPAVLLAVAVGPAGSAFYQPPLPLPGTQHGDVIWARPLTGSPVLPSAASNELILYRTRTPDGRDVAVSGMLAVPKGTPPAGGWPVISWAHGTTGDGVLCTPSLDAPGEPEHSYLGPIDPVLDSFVKHGFAVVQTDYTGEGTPGVQPYLDGASEARDVIDIVRAARQVEPSLSTRWVAAGHSQGGHSALFATSLSQSYAPDLQNLGGVAMAPVSDLPELITYASTLATPTPAFAVVALFIAGEADLDPAVRPDAIFNLTGLAMLPQIRQLCFDSDLVGPRSFGGIAPARVFRSDADLAALLRDAANDEPGSLAYAAPLLLLQGTADMLVRPALTDRLFAQLCDGGATVRYVKYAGQTHDSLVPASAAAALSWITSRFAGAAAPTTCGAAAPVMQH